MSSPTDCLRWRAPVAADHARLVAALQEWTSAAGAHEAIEAAVPDRLLALGLTTSELAEDPDGAVAAFVVALPADDEPGVGYVQFVWVRPDHRRHGLARGMYERALAGLAQAGCTRVHAETSSVNRGSIAFHEALGFHAETVGAAAPSAGPTGAGPTAAGPTGPEPTGPRRILLTRDLTAPAPLPAPAP